MHPHQVDLDVSIVAALVAAQFPQWRELGVEPIRSHGTVNALFRLGESHLLRFPLIPGSASVGELVAEQQHARRLAPSLPLPIPEPVAIGRPAADYPGAWSVYLWIKGQSLDQSPELPADALARDLAGFVHALHRIDSGDARWSGTGRGGPLGERNDDVEQHLRAAAGAIDADAVRRLWQRCLTVAGHSGAQGWIHADLMPGNLITRDGQLVAVIDLGTGQVGDPAVDLMPAWNLFGPAGRTAYRRALGTDDAEWERGRGWAIVQAVPTIAYYAKTNPAMSRLGIRTVQAVLDDAGAG